MRFPRRHSSADDAVEALLRDVANLRLTLDTDLTVAAAAAEANRLDVAAEIVEFDRAEIAAFAETATGRIAEPVEQTEPVETPQVVEPRRHAEGVPWRHRLALAAAPAMLAAAAIIAVVGVSGGGTAPHQQTAAPPRLVASYSALTELARSDRDPAALIAVGSELNRSLAKLIAESANDPAKAAQVLRILRAEQQLLTFHHPKGADRLLAQAAALVRELQQTVPLAGLDVPAVNDPGKASLPPLVIAPLPTTNPAPSSDSKPQPTSAATHSPSPAPDNDQPEPEPTSGDTTVPPEPSPSPTVLDPWPFGSGGGSNQGN